MMRCSCCGQTRKFPANMNHYGWSFYPFAPGYFRDAYSTPTFPVRASLRSYRPGWAEGAD